MSNKQLCRRAHLLHRLRKQGIRCLTKEYTIFFPYGEDPNAISEIRNLRGEFNFTVQFEI